MTPRSPVTNPRGSIHVLSEAHSADHHDPWINTSSYRMRERQLGKDSYMPILCKATRWVATDCIADEMLPHSTAALSSYEDSDLLSRRRWEYTGCCKTDEPSQATIVEMIEGAREGGRERTRIEI